MLYVYSGVYLGVRHLHLRFYYFIHLIGTGRNGSFAFLADWIRMDDTSVSNSQSVAVLVRVSCTVIGEQIALL